MANKGNSAMISREINIREKVLNRVKNLKDDRSLNILSGVTAKLTIQRMMILFVGPAMFRFKDPPMLGIIKPIMIWYAIVVPNTNKMRETSSVYLQYLPNTASVTEA